MKVLFFSQLRDVAGASEITVDLQNGARVIDLLDELYARTPALRAWDNRILIGAGVEFVDRDYVLQPDEEIAIMPPVQGG